MPQKTIEDATTFASMIARKQGWALNPDAEFTRGLVEGLWVNYNRYGYYLCPCRDSEGSREADAKAICPCSPAWKDIEEHGHCFCALYLAREFAEAGRSPQSIPDRRSQF